VFLVFFYLLRARGLKPSVQQWMTLMEALNLGLEHASFTGFYHLCRSILLTSESEFDRFDQVFYEFFKDIAEAPEIPEEFLEWLSESPRITDAFDRPDILEEALEFEDLLKRLEERLKEQKERHDGGNYWVGTGGTSTQGHGGYNTQGIRVGGQGRHRSALAVAGERRFRDFREDNMLDIRHFQMALRKLRQFSSRDAGQKTELDLDETIEKTGKNAGRLELVFDKPRVNTVKLLVLFDCDGSMEPYRRISSRLFQAVSKNNHFKDLKFYYFHNCIYDMIYTSPECIRGEWMETDRIRHTLGGDYKVIIVGDAAMAPYELFQKCSNGLRGFYEGDPGFERLRQIRKHFDEAVWLNPIPEEWWEHDRGYRTIAAIRELFPMYGLTIEGLEQAVKKLLVAR